MDPERPELKVGDIVTIAERPHPLTWTIEAIEDHTELELGLPPAFNAIAQLRSGNTGRRRYEMVRNLTLFTGRTTP